MKWRRAQSGYPTVYVSEDGRFQIRSYEDRYNLRRMIVNKGWKLYDDNQLVGKFDLLRDAKTEAEKIEAESCECRRYAVCAKCLGLLKDDILEDRPEGLA